MIWAEISSGLFSASEFNPFCNNRCSLIGDLFQGGNGILGSQQFRALARGRKFICYLDLCFQLGLFLNKDEILQLPLRGWENDQSYLETFLL